MESKKFIKTNLKLRDYKAYEDKIVFEIKFSINRGDIKIPPTLKQFTQFDYLYVKIGSRYKKFKIKEGQDRKYKVFRVYVGKGKRKNYEAYLKPTLQFNKILSKAINSKLNIFNKYKNPDTRLEIDNEGKLLLRFLVPGLKRNRQFMVHNILQNRVKTFKLKTFKSLIGSSGIDAELLGPFTTNYFVTKTKKELKFPNKDLPLKKEVFRAIGLINGDGNANRWSIFFYGHNGILHNDFKKGISLLDPNLKSRKRYIRGKVRVTEFNSTSLIRFLCKFGLLKGDKLKIKDNINIGNNFYLNSEYLSGFYDCEGCFIRDSHLIIPSSTSLYNKEYSLLTDSEYNWLLELAKVNCKLKIMESGSEYYGIGISKLKGKKKGLEILKKAYISEPPLSVLYRKLLNELGINCKLEFKTLLLYPKTKKISASWWVKITNIHEVIKFISVVDLHDKKKEEKIRNFIFNYITKEDFEEIKNFIKQKIQNGHSNQRLNHHERNKF